MNIFNIMNEFKINHLKKCLRIANIYLASLFKNDTLNKLLDNNIDIIIAYLIYFAFEPIEYINMYYDLKNMNNDNVSCHFHSMFGDYHYNALVKLKGDSEYEK